MNTAAASRDSGPISILLRGQWERCIEWTQQWSTRRVLLWTLFIVLGAGLYGAAMGCWRSPLQAIYNLVKFPLVHTTNRDYRWGKKLDARRNFVSAAEGRD